MIEVKLFRYNSNNGSDGYRGEDLSEFVLTGAQNTENLTEELDVSELTLQGYPYQKEFEPSSKFIIDIYEDGTRVATYHRIVQEDVVEKTILSDDNYYKHSISFVEPSAIAQKRIVDNISISYKLKDVNLETKVAFDTSRIAMTSVDNSVPTGLPRGFANYVDSTWASNTRNTSFGKYFVWKDYNNESDIKVVYSSESQHTTVKTSLYYIDINDIVDVIEDGVTKKKVQFQLPVPHIMWGLEDTTNRPPIVSSYQDIGIASFLWILTERDTLGRETNKLWGYKISKSDLSRNGDLTSFPYDWAVTNYKYGKANFIREFLLEKETTSITTTTGAGGGQEQLYNYGFYFSKYTDPTNSDSVDLEAGFITTPAIDIKEGSTYSIELKVVNLDEGNVPSLLTMFRTGTVGSGAYAYSSTGDEKSKFVYTKLKTGYAPYATETTLKLNDNNVSISTQFQFYGSADIKAVISSGIPYSALNLVKKAIINSDTYFAKNGVSPVDIENGDYPFYISNDMGENIVTADDLALIQVNETFYNQKNLWEILIDAGKYAHAIPQITFGDDDKFAISFYKLGTTNKSVNGNDPMSIMNFRKIDDYISACSSYVDNLVQLGGQIEELVAPKTTNEKYVVDNNNAEIIVSKPIIEVLKVVAIATTDMPNESIVKNSEADITQYIYEKAIYNILSINKDDDPNKGIALYYELGDNAIKGGDYQLPQKFTNAYSDFSFKKILYSAFHGGYDNTIDTAAGPWVNLKVNNFIFRVTYRTKDTARLEHFRPDLRHYLLSSKYDKYPVNRQFNNQQDILLDSVAFGANMFGKLIRTGNSNYKVQEWCDSISNIKHKGQLYIINGDWFYVARVTNIFFPDHIESIVEYSKDYNQLSEIIGIPSEPRFYEISEKSSIDREVSIGDLLLITTDENKIDDTNGFIQTISHTKDLIMANGGTFLKWAETILSGSESLQEIEEGTFGVKKFEKAIISPISAYSCGNTLSYEWDMVDNFSAGDSVDKEVTIDGKTADDAYRAMRAVQYCDQYGKATLFKFNLFAGAQFTSDQVRNFPVDPFYSAFNNKVNIKLKLKDGNVFRDDSTDWFVDYDDPTQIITPEGNTCYVLGKSYNPQAQQFLWDIYGVDLYLYEIESNMPDLEELLTTDWLTDRYRTSIGSSPNIGSTILFTVYYDDNTTTKEILVCNYIGSSSWGVKYIFTNYKKRITSNLTELYFSWNEDFSQYIEFLNFQLSVVGTDLRSIILLKDSREALHFTYNLSQITDSDTFVLSPFFFTEKRAVISSGIDYAPQVKIVMMAEEVNKMSNGYIGVNSIIYENESPSIYADNAKITIDLSWINNLTNDIKSQAKSIVIMQKLQTGESQMFIIAKNLPNSLIDEPAQNWYIGAPNKENVFINKQ